jgi:hypothetical protein
VRAERSAVFTSGKTTACLPYRVSKVDDRLGIRQSDPRDPSPTVWRKSAATGKLHRE